MEALEVLDEGRLDDIIQNLAGRWGAAERKSLEKDGGSAVADFLGGIAKSAKDRLADKGREVSDKVSSKRKEIADKGKEVIDKFKDASVGARIKAFDEFISEFGKHYDRVEVDKIMQKFEDMEPREVYSVMRQWGEKILLPSLNKRIGQGKEMSKSAEQFAKRAKKILNIR